MWKRFLIDLSKAMLMTDPIAYGYYLTWTLEAQERGDFDRATLGLEGLELISIALERHEVEPVVFGSPGPVNPKG